MIISIIISTVHLDIAKDVNTGWVITPINYYHEYDNNNMKQRQDTTIGDDMGSSQDYCV